MSVSYSYVPPKLDAIALVQAAAAEAAEAAADALLAAAQELVPVDSGKLRDSGRVHPDGTSAAVSFGREDDAQITGWKNDIAVGDSPSAAYAVKQHEDLALHHDNGQAKFLESVLHSEGEHVAEIVAVTLRKALG